MHNMPPSSTFPQNKDDKKILEISLQKEVI